MPRYKLILEYDGGPFVGWQRQENGPSVQGALEAAARAFTGADVTAHAAGRTDAGVHALAMGAHLDLPGGHSAATVRDALNQHLKPAPIAVLSAEEASEDFHARFSARARHYLYRIVNRRAPLTLQAGRAFLVQGRIDIAPMREAAALLIGKHDFTTFRSAQCQSASPVKTLTALVIEQSGERIDIYASAPSFLHHQVRSIAGTLLQAGLGRWSPAQVKAARDAADRAACGPVAPAHGLYFLKADYDRT
ncbi:MAG: tRNA pseudouridine(38-40) synthase TruA [Amphiplicatus sp.]